MIDYNRVLGARRRLLSDPPAPAAEGQAQGQADGQPRLDPWSARLLLLTHLTFPEREARRTWEAVLAHGRQLEGALDRPVGLATAAADYFLNVQRRLVAPAVIELDELEAEWRAAALDPLTGLLSAATFRDEVATEVARARRSRRPVSVVVWDLDDSGKLGAVHGAAELDSAICEAADLLRSTLRDFDRLARPGGDELCALLPGADAGAAAAVAERFRERLAARFAERRRGDVSFRLTVSAGVAGYPEDAPVAESLLEFAAAALAAAKSAGKNRVVRFGAAGGRPPAGENA